MKTIIKNLADKVLEGPKECRDIYSMCCQQIMAEITEDGAALVISSIYPTIQKGLKHEDSEVVEEFVDLLTEMLKRFTKTFLTADGENLVNQSALLKQMFKQILNS